MMRFRLALCFMMLLSLCMSCHNDDDSLYFFSIFHADTGEELGTFLNKGMGPEEFADLHKIYSFFNEVDELKTVLLDFPKERLCIWNINRLVCLFLINT